MAVLSAGVAVGAARGGPLEVDCAPVAVRVTALESSLQTTGFGCGSYNQFTCFSHRLTVAVQVDEASARPVEVGLRLHELARDGRGHTEVDHQLKHKGGGRYEKTLAFHTDLSSLLKRDLVPFVVAPEVGAQGALKRCFLEPRGASGGYFTVTNEGAQPQPSHGTSYSARVEQPLPADGESYSARVAAPERPRTLVFPLGAVPYADGLLGDGPVAADVFVQELHGSISLLMRVDDAAVREVVAHDGFERPFALVPTTGGGWRRVELAYQRSLDPRQPGGPVLDAYAYTLVEDGVAVWADLDLERLRSTGVAFGVELTDDSGQLPSVLWTQEWGHNYRPFPWDWRP